MSNEKTSLKKSVISKLITMVIIIAAAAFLGQLAVPAFLKAMFL